MGSVGCMDVNTLEALGLTKEGLVDNLVERLMHDYDLAGAVERQVVAGVKERLGKAADESVARVLDEHMHELLKSEITPVNHWGEPAGEPTTMRDILYKQSLDYWDCKVGKEGRPTNGYGGEPRARRMMRELGKEVFAEAMRKESAEVVKAFRASLSKDLAYKAEQALSNAFLNSKRG